MLKKIFLISLIVYAVNTSDCTTAATPSKEECATKTAADNQYCCFGKFIDANNAETKKCFELPKKELDQPAIDTTIDEQLAFTLALPKMNQNDWPDKGKIFIEHCKVANNREVGQQNPSDIQEIKCMGKANPSNETCIYEIDADRKCCYGEMGSEKSCTVVKKTIYDGKTGPFKNGEETINCYIPPKESKKSGAAFLKSVLALISLLTFL